LQMSRFEHWSLLWQSCRGYPVYLCSTFSCGKRLSDSLCPPVNSFVCERAMEGRRTCVLAYCCHWCWEIGWGTDFWVLRIFLGRIGDHLWYLWWSHERQYVTVFWESRSAIGMSKMSVRVGGIFPFNFKLWNKYLTFLYKTWFALLTLIIH
jgi:hypothetical protein